MRPSISKSLKMAWFDSFQVVWSIINKSFCAFKVRYVQYFISVSGFRWGNVNRHRLHAIYPSLTTCSSCKVHLTTNFRQSATLVGSNISNSCMAPTFSLLCSQDPTTILWPLPFNAAHAPRIYLFKIYFSIFPFLPCSAIPIMFYSSNYLYTSCLYVALHALPKICISF